MASRDAFYVGVQTASAAYPDPSAGLPKEVVQEVAASHADIRERKPGRRENSVSNAHRFGPKRAQRGTQNFMLSIHTRAQYQRFDEQASRNGVLRGEDP